MHLAAVLLVAAQCQGDTGIPINYDFDAGSASTAIEDHNNCFVSTSLKMYLPSKGNRPGFKGTIECGQATCNYPEGNPYPDGCPPNPSPEVNSGIEPDPDVPGIASNGYMSLTDWQAAMKAADMTYIADCAKPECTLNTLSKKAEAYFTGALVGSGIAGIVVAIILMRVKKYCDNRK